MIALQEKSSLCPTLITDAKALYDAFHKESSSTSSSVDKRTYLEIRVAKQQVTELGGSLRWVSSERQYADGLTKTSTRSLLADRWRDGRIKLVWDPCQLRQCKEENKRRERQEQARVCNRAPQEENQNNIHNPQTTTNHNKQHHTSRTGISRNLRRIPVQAVAWNKHILLRSKIPFGSLMVCYTQVKAVIGW